MAKERLSKLQKWILTKCLEEGMFHRNKIREFYGKKYSPAYKDKELYESDVYKADKHMLEERGVEEKEWDFEGETFIRKYTGKTYIRKYKVIKEQYITTKAEEVTISRTFGNLKNKNLLNAVGKWGRCYLSEKGFLIAKNFLVVQTFINYKEYKKVIDEEIEKYSKPFSLGYTPEQKKKIAEYETKLKEYESKFNIKTISELCCEECLDKIVKLQKDSGVEEVKSLKQEAEELLKS